MTPNLKTPNSAAWEVTYKKLLILASQELWNGVKYVMEPQFHHAQAASLGALMVSGFLILTYKEFQINLAVN